MKTIRGMHNIWIEEVTHQEVRQTRPLLKWTDPNCTLCSNWHPRRREVTRPARSILEKKHLRDVITVSHKTIKNCFRNLLTSELHVGCSSAKIQSTNIPQKSYENLLLGSGNRPWPAPIINVTLVECSRLPSYYCSSIANRKYPTQHLFIRRFLVNHQLYSNHQILSQLFAEESGSSQQETTFLIRRDIEIFISPPIPSPQIRFTSFQPLFFPLL